MAYRAWKGEGNILSEVCHCEPHIFLWRGNPLISKNTYLHNLNYSENGLPRHFVPRRDKSVAKYCHFKFLIRLL